MYTPLLLQVQYKSIFVIAYRTRGESSSRPDQSSKFADHSARFLPEGEHRLSCSEQPRPLR